MGNIGTKRKSLSEVGKDVNFDHFQVLRAIGKGSFGKVCIVQKKSTDCLFAMKYMNKSQCEAKDAVPNVFREIEILAALDHPFLVNLWFSFQDEEDMFMVVDLLLGGDLRYHVQQCLAFTDEAVRLFILEAGSALDYLHKKKIIHRDIKPDNLLLDAEGHVHLTDFNIATVLKKDHLATSMSGTKPYMAPEIFECACECCDGYNYHIDWWSLGVTAYEVRRGKRPYDIHANTTLTEVRLMFLTSPKYPTDWSQGFAQLLNKLLTLSPTSRITSLEELLRTPFVSGITANDIINKRFQPLFTPPKDHLNCDPTFELEEMIIEAKPLHKKKKRLMKQKSLRESQPALISQKPSSSSIYDKMLIYNREREEIRKAKEKKEREWQEELDRSMNLSDPTGQGSTFRGRKLSLKTKRGKQDDPKDGVLGTLISSSAKSLSATIGPIQGFKKNEDTKSNEKARPLVLEPFPEEFLTDNLLETQSIGSCQLIETKESTNFMAANVGDPINNSADDKRLSLNFRSLKSNESEQKVLEEMKTSLVAENHFDGAGFSESRIQTSINNNDNQEQNSICTSSAVTEPVKNFNHNALLKKALNSFNPTNRSLSFYEPEIIRHEKFFPQRNSCDFQTKGNKLTLRDDENAAQLRNDCRNIKSISLQSYSSSPKYTSSLEYIRNTSSSGNIGVKNKLQTTPTSTSDESKLHDCSSSSKHGKTTSVGINPLEIKSHNQKEQINKKKHFNKTTSSHSLQLQNQHRIGRQCYRRTVSTDNTSQTHSEITQKLHAYLSENLPLDQSTSTPQSSEEHESLNNVVVNTCEMKDREKQRIIDQKLVEEPLMEGETKNICMKSKIHPNEIKLKETVKCNLILDRSK